VSALAFDLAGLICAFHGSEVPLGAAPERAKKGGQPYCRLTPLVNRDTRIQGLWITIG
jgi:hypothetical protein